MDYLDLNARCPSKAFTFNHLLTFVDVIISTVASTC